MIIPNVSNNLDIRFTICYSETNTSQQEEKGYMREIEKNQCLEALGSIMREERTRRGLTQNEVATKIGINQAHYSMIENGKRDAEFVTIVKICQTLHIDLTAFVASYL